MSEMAREVVAAAAGAGAGASEKPADSGDSKFKGVRKRKWGKWVSEIRLPNSRERIWLGSYDSAEKAARAFDAAQFCLRGRNARFNFPDDPPDIAGGRSLTPSEIQVAAAQFANSAAPAPSAAAAACSDPSRRSSGNRDLSSEYPPAGSELRAESASSMSDGTPMDCDLGVDVDMNVDMNGPFMELLGSNVGMGSGNYGADFGLYPGYDPFTMNDFYGHATIPNGGFGDENFDGLPVQDFLWNF